MTLADQIGAFAAKSYIEPARAAGHERVTITTGDVHRQMGLSSRMPAVCGALTARKFQAENHMTLESREGPYQGATVRLTYHLHSSAQGPRDFPESVLPKPPALGEKSRVTADDLARWRRNIVRLLDAIEGRAGQREGLATRIRRLTWAGHIPRDTSTLMLAVSEARNAAEYDAKELSLIEATAVRSAWAVILEWARARGVTLEARTSGWSGTSSTSCPPRVSQNVTRFRLINVRTCMEYIGDYYARLDERRRIADGKSQLLVYCLDLIGASLWSIAGGEDPQALVQLDGCIEIAFKAEPEAVHRVLVADTRRLDYESLKRLLRDAFLAHPRGRKLQIDDYDIEQTITFAEAKRRVTDLVQSVRVWEQGIDEFHAARNEIVHYGPDRARSGEYARMIATIGFPFVSDLLAEVGSADFQRAVTPPIGRELSVAKRVCEVARQHGVEVGRYCLKTVRLAYASRPRPVAASGRQRP
jgi:hypothetical protein